MFHPIDVHVGQRVRFKRKVVGLTQSDLGLKVGLTFQQIQKYEKGENRISASKLYQIATVLNTHVDFFFEDYSESKVNTKELEADIATINLVNSYKKISNPKLQKRIQNLIYAMTEEDNLLNEAA